ncbi:MAG: metallophosphoesterase [Deinococcus sp.]|nr:metallophosphoesterase [Deinococcus sp.]
MRVLAVSDVIEEDLYGPGIERFRGVEAILSAGDLPASYLDYLASALSVPLFYVYGNHAYGTEHTHTGLDLHHPPGVNLDTQVVHYRGLVMAGLEGSMRYSGGPHQYSEGEMRLKAMRLWPRLALERLRGRRPDVLLTHAPPRGIHDALDLPHQGFQTFLDFIRWCQPRFVLHGHVHCYDRRQPRRTVLGDTVVLNVYGHQLLEL